MTTGAARERALVPRGRARAVRPAPLVRRLLPEPLRSVQDDLETRLAQIPTTLNEYGLDPFGYEPRLAAQMLLPAALVYRYWLRVETSGIERVPDGRVLLIANHAGNTFAWDGLMLSMSMLLDHEPPRAVRGMAEYYLPTIPFFGTLMHRAGSVVGTPDNCVQLLERGEAIMVFPEGERGFVKPYAQRYQLQRFGLGFLRLALETETPIVPVGIVGSEEQSPGFARSRWLGKLFGAPVAPISLTFPWLGLASFVPLPVKFRLHFGEPLRFEGDPNEEDAEVQKKVDVVKRAIRGLVAEGLAERRGWFR
ncbi:MAG: glycerol acyltransferase [Proteobacteria bacterium]|nr:MAG: glycerol acyltransferase [Pseudomonadota bacterium]